MIAGMNDTTDRATRHDVVSVAEAADVLGITPDSVRARLRRGSLAGEKQGTTWMVHLGRATPRDVTRHRDTTSRDSDRDELLEELRNDKRYLQEQLDRALRQLEAERQRADVLQLRAIGTGETSSSEATGSPQANETGPRGLWARVRRWWA